MNFLNDKGRSIEGIYSGWFQLIMSGEKFSQSQGMDDCLRPQQRHINLYIAMPKDDQFPATEGEKQITLTYHHRIIAS